jgi:glycosyltransferase involved in cell wall biosynthesis
MSAGLPVVVSRIGGLPELVENGLNGFLFDPSSETELAEAILALASNEDLRARIGTNGRKRAIEKFDLVHVVSLWTDVLLRPGSFGRR